jgi:threonine/homoserine efflux transporter RhtA
VAFAMLGGWIAFRHIPDYLAWLGIAVIAASGVGNALLTTREISKTPI